MPVLHLGVIDLPYAVPPPKGRRKKRLGSMKTTGDVAVWLEDKYHPMEVFFQEHQQDIANDLEEGLRDTLESLLMGAPASLNAFGAAESKIMHRFKQFLSLKEMDALGIPGVPTKAALDGVSHRFKNPYAKRGPRPSFIDTGLYQSSFKAWVE